MTHRELSAAECRELLGAGQVGRVAFVTPDGPRIVPVNYVVAGQELRFRTTWYSELAQHAVGTQVAFEVDRLDEAARSGWSVVALGVCQRSDSLDDDAEDGAQSEPWAGGPRPARLRLAWASLTGRSVGEAGWPHPEVPREQ